MKMKMKDDGDGDGDGEEEGCVCHAIPYQTDKQTDRQTDVTHIKPNTTSVYDEANLHYKIMDRISLYF